jgi:hypothetical protein
LKINDLEYDENNKILDFLKNTLNQSPKESTKKSNFTFKGDRSKSEIFGIMNNNQKILKVFENNNN